ncbi:MAG TPA: SPOR domain-containing protein [Tepidisphaeraceae bacterium]|nr:SPOR domain-containing protein [Tepidisphaeraceae bacterium]
MRTTGIAAAAWLVSITILAAGLGCQNAKDTQNLREGYSALDQKNYDRAIAAADDYLKKYPSGNGAAEAAYLRGRAFEQRTKGSDAEANANLREARASYEKALTLMPPRQLEGYIRTSLGNVAYWMNDFGAAEINWTAAYEKLDPGDLKSWVLYRTGLSQQRLGKWETADDTFAQVEKEFPKSEPAARAASHQGARAFYVQVAAFSTPQPAENLVNTLRKQGFPAGRYEKKERGLQLVMAGPLKRYDEAVAMKNRLGEQYRDAVIVP